ncbi:MAG: hypothetical protein ABGZ17_16535 [Planctomycetaceae bacterium]
MKCERFEQLDRHEMQTVAGGLHLMQLQAATGLINYDWLKTAAAKLRANLQVLPPKGQPCEGVKLLISSCE